MKHLSLSLEKDYSVIIGAIKELPLSLFLWLIIREGEKETFGFIENVAATEINRSQALPNFNIPRKSLLSSFVNRSEKRDIVPSKWTFPKRVSTAHIRG